MLASYLSPIPYSWCQDRETLDATLGAAPGAHEIQARPEVGGQRIPLTDQQFEDLIRLHLADFTEQVGLSALHVARMMCCTGERASTSCDGGTGYRAKGSHLNKYITYTVSPPGFNCASRIPQ